MKISKGLMFMGAICCAPIANTMLPVSATAETASDINRQSAAALAELTRTNPAAASLARSARAILIFPSITKAGLVFGAAYGEGQLTQNGMPTTYYNSFTGSWGIQAGAQTYGYVVFLMKQSAVDYIRESKGWEVGVGPTVVVVNEGMAANLSTSTAQDDAYAFIFNQQGLMAGVSIEGTKITKIRP